MIRLKLMMIQLKIKMIWLKIKLIQLKIIMIRLKKMNWLKIKMIQLKLIIIGLKIIMIRLKRTVKLLNARLLKVEYLTVYSAKAKVTQLFACVSESNPSVFQPCFWKMKVYLLRWIESKKIKFQKYMALLSQCNNLLHISVNISVKGEWICEGKMDLKMVNGSLKGELI